MSIFNARANMSGAGIATGAVRGGWRFLWQLVRAPLLGILMLLEPLVRYLLGLAMVLGIVASVIFELSAAGSRFPFLAMLAGSLACGLVLFLYYGLIALPAR